MMAVLVLKGKYFGFENSKKTYNLLVAHISVGNDFHGRSAISFHEPSLFGCSDELQREREREREKESPGISSCRKPPKKSQ